MFGGDFGLPPGMGVAPRVVRRPSPTYVTPSRLAARRAASLEGVESIIMPNHRANCLKDRSRLARSSGGTCVVAQTPPPRGRVAI